MRHRRKLPRKPYFKRGDMVIYEGQRTHVVTGVYMPNLPFAEQPFMLENGHLVQQSELRRAEEIANIGNKSPEEWLTDFKNWAGTVISE